MSEETTRNLPSSFEERVLSELAAIRQEVTQQNNRLSSVESRLTSLENRMDSMEARLTSLEGRLTSLEDKVDERLRETRPIWEGIQAQLKEMEKQFINFNRQVKMLIRDSFDMRSRVEALEDSLPET